MMKALPKRSGGHAHPDFPFVGYYKHKRIISPYQTNLWVYDGMNPEFLVDIMVPQYSLGHLASRNLLMAWLFPIVLSWIMGTVIHKYFARPFMPSTVKDNNDPVRRFLKKMKHENVIRNFKHPLGHFHTYEADGWTPQYSTYISNRYTL